MSGIPRAASTIPGSVVTFTSWDRLRSRRIWPSSSSSANTRAGTRMPLAGRRSISYRHGPTARSSRSPGAGDVGAPAARAIFSPSDIEDHLRGEPAVPLLDGQVVVGRRLDGVAQPLDARAPDGRDEPAVVEVRDVQPGEEDPGDLRAEDELVQPLDQERLAVGGAHRHLLAPAGGRLQRVPAHDAGERATGLDEELGQRRGVDPDLELTAVLLERMARGNHHLQLRSPARRRGGCAGARAVPAGA